MDNTLKFKILVGIAKADNDFDNSELDFIKYLADRQGLTFDILKALLKKKINTNKLIKELDFDEKIEILAYTIKLMKVDGKVLLSEIKYCKKLAIHLGFEERSIEFLSEIVEEDPHIDPNFGRIKQRMKQYLINPD
jgi:uncharacterized tellurite resistance protein B-like protein